MSLIYAIEFLKIKVEMILKNLTMYTMCNL